MQPDSRIARQIIETLGQSGTPYAKGVSYYNVGNESLLNAIDTYYFKSYLLDGGATFKLVVGDYGSGKSHFLYCVQEHAWENNFAVSKVDLSPKESPYDDQKRVYAAVASLIVYQDKNEVSENDPGLSRFLESTLRRILQPHQLEPSDEGASDIPEIQALLETIKNTLIDSPSYKKAVYSYLQALLLAQTQRLESLERWLHGEETTSDDMRDLRGLGVTEKINKQNAFKMLRSLCQVIRALGYSGLALLFDEGDRMLSIGSKAEKVATDNLREVIDRCRSDLPGALFMYAVPPEFLHSIVPQYPALQQRVQTPNYFSRINPFSPQINLEHLDVGDRQLLEQIGQKLLPIFNSAFNCQLDEVMQLENIQVFAEAAEKSYLATNHRRLFVKALVIEWHRQLQEGEQIIPLPYAEATIKGQHADLESQEDNQQTPY